MVATNFEFNGISAKDIGLCIVNFDDNKNGLMDVGGEITWNTSKAVNNSKWNIHGKHYENPRTITFQLCKWDSISKRPTDFSPSEQAYFRCILEDTDGYKPLRFLVEGYENIYFMATISIKWYQINGYAYGAELAITCDAPWGYSPIQVFEANIGREETFQIYNDSDTIGTVEFQHIEIHLPETGICPSETETHPTEEREINISNNLDAFYNPNALSMVIKNCSANETIIINGLTKQIQSSNTKHTTLANDYSYHPIHLIHFDTSTRNQTESNGFKTNRINTFTNHGCDCHISLAYRTVRTAVIG